MGRNKFLINGEKLNEKSRKHENNNINKKNTNGCFSFRFKKKWAAEN